MNLRNRILAEKGSAVEVAQRLNCNEHYVRRVRRTADPDAHLAWLEINRDYERDRYRFDPRWRTMRLRNQKAYRVRRKARSQ